MTAQDISTKAGLSTAEATALAALQGAGQHIFTTEDFKRVFPGSDDYVWHVLQDLVRKRWLARLSRGKYLIIPLEAGVEGLTAEHDLVIAAHLVHPYTIAYWTALNLHGFTEQFSAVVYVGTPRRVSPRRRHILGTEYHIVTLTERKFFGLETTWLGDVQVAITDGEKTVIDCLDQPRYAGGIEEVSKAFQDHGEVLDFAKLDRYAQRMGNSAILKRMGYLVELYRLEVPFLKQWALAISPGYSLLDPTKAPGGPHNRRWQLRINTGVR